MPRYGKKTLYLDLDALDKLRAALDRLPGRPSLSSYLNDTLPALADQMDRMTLAAERGGLRGVADYLNVLGEVGAAAERIDEEVKTALETSEHPDKPLSQMVLDVPPKKPRKTSAKKAVEK